VGHSSIRHRRGQHYEVIIIEDKIEEMVKRQRGVTSEEASDLSIPRNAVKRIMKLEGDVKQVQQEAVIVVARATVHCPQYT